MPQEMSAEDLGVEGQGSFVPPPHITDGSPCWCESIDELVHPDNLDEEN